MAFGKTFIYIKDSTNVSITFMAKQILYYLMFALTNGIFKKKTIKCYKVCFKYLNFCLGGKSLKVWLKRRGKLKQALTSIILKYFCV